MVNFNIDTFQKKDLYKKSNHEQINISKFYENCELDYCATIKQGKTKNQAIELSLCNSFAAAASECSANSINIESVR